MSSNGSPLGCFNTVVKAKNPNAGTSLVVPPTPGVFVPLATGDVIDLESVNVDDMTADMKIDALNQMQTMISNMQKLMQKLESSTTTSSV